MLQSTSAQFASRKRLLDLLDKIVGVPIVVVGDLILDRYIWGKVERISPEAPVPVVEMTALEDRLGGAGNVASNLIGLGCKVALCGFVGDDEDGKQLLSLIAKAGIEPDGMIIDKSRPTVLKTRVIAHSQQVVRIDRERKAAPTAAVQEAFAALVEAKLPEARVIVLSDYGKGTLSEPLAKRLEAAQKDGRITLERCPLVVDPHPRSYSLYRGMTVAKPNRKEAESAIGKSITTPEQARGAAKEIMQKWNASLAMITLGEDGMVLLDAAHPEGVLIPTEAREVFDVSGAGDTVTAVFSAALGAGASPVEAGVLANIAAGIVVSEVGTVAISADTLRARIEERQ